jgi:formate dehydrogenase iron-sulfur subunit
LDQLREHAEHRLAQLQNAGQDKAQLYLADEDDGVGGAGAFFLLLDDPEVYGLPPDPVDTRRELGSIWRATGAAALGLGVGLAAAVLGGRG